MPRLSLVLVACSIALAGGCDGPTGTGPEPEAQPEPSAEPEPSGPVATPFYPDVAAIVEMQCKGCHVTGGVSPFPLETYDDVKALGDVIKVATGNRTMPPFHINNDGSCQTYAGARWLSDEDIALIAAWVDEGMAEGDPALAPEPRPDAPLLPRIDSTAPIETYTPIDNFDDYRCFVVESPVVADQFLTGVQVHPGARALIHHIDGYQLGPEAEIEARARDMADPGPGFDCQSFLDSEDGAYIFGYLPGQGANLYPEGLGVRLVGGAPWMVQIHYSTLQGTESDSTTIDLMLEDNVDQEVFFAWWDDDELYLPAGERAATWTFGNSDWYPIEIDVDLRGVITHMHERGRQVSIEHMRNNDVVGCLADVPDYDAAWQEMFLYEEPIRINSGDRIQVTCTFNTEDAVGPVLYGNAANDEMCMMGFLYTIP